MVFFFKKNKQKTHSFVMIVKIIDMSIFNSSQKLILDKLKICFFNHHMENTKAIRLFPN